MSRHDSAGMLGGDTHGILATSEHIPRQYHSVAGQPAAALQGTTVAPLTLVDFIDDRVRAIDAERTRLMMVKEQLTSAGITMAVEDLRRLLG